MDNIQTSVKGQKFIRYTQSKTGKQVDIPLHNDVLEILSNRGGFPRAISDQKFNDYIKLVCKSDKVKLNETIYGTRQNPKTHIKEVGYFEKWQLVRSHICRRSFATNHYNKLPNKLIMAVTGHSTEKMLLNYIGETENDHIEDFLSVWNTPTKENDNIIELNTKTS
jgi:integrase